MPKLKLTLVDVNPAVVAALREAFASSPEVSVVLGDLLEVAHGTVVSPANSQGFMDGGIDHAYAAFFGEAFRRSVRDAMLAQPEGFLPIGAAMALPTGHPRVRYVVFAPTMTTPEHVYPENAYRALRAALRLMSRSPELGSTLFCPGMTTLVGGVAPRDAAREMFQAYADWKENARDV
jgi:O-acetyl-ADP-ribose deacetylase (regulator of RNase III)